MEIVAQSLQINLSGKTGIVCLSFQLQLKAESQIVFPIRVF